MADLLITFVVNAGTKARKETLDGKSYLVAPIVMLTPGVHAGNEGPVLYKEGPLKSSVPAWNKKPIPVYHPQINGKYVSASDPAVADKRNIGFLNNVKYDAGLKAEGWFDEEKTKEVDPRVHDALVNGKTMEVSTGMMGTTITVNNGNYNGESYVLEATSIDPDHLAILPDKIGACSVEKGCGCGGSIIVNEEETNPLLANEASFSAIMQNLQQATRSQFGYYTYIRDVYKGFFVYSGENGKDLYMRKYSTDKEGKVSLGSDEAVKVKWVQEYRTLDNKFIGNCGEPLENNMDRNAKITLLINAKIGFDEANRASLTALPDDKFESVYKTWEAAVNPKPNPPTPTILNTGTNLNPPAPATLTVDQYIAAAPPGLREQLQALHQQGIQQKEMLVVNIMASPNNKFTKEFLLNQSADVLQGMASLAAASTPTPSYLGQGTASVLVNAGGPSYTPPQALIAPELFPAKK